MPASITCTIPIAVGAGTGYRIRVVSSSPPVTGADNGSDLVVRSLAQCTGQAAPAEVWERTRLLLWPNPSAGGQLRLQLDGFDLHGTKAEVEVHALTGARMLQRTLPLRGDTHSAQATLDLGPDLPRGSYIVTVVVVERTYVQRLVIQ